MDMASSQSSLDTSTAQVLGTHRITAGEYDQVIHEIRQRG